MAAAVVLDEMHLTFRIPVTLPDPAVTVIRRTLTGKAFTTTLRRAVLAIVRQRPVLQPVRVSITR